MIVTTQVSMTNGASLLLAELERIEWLPDQALPGRSAAHQNTAWRSIWRRLDRTDRRRVNSDRPRRLWEAPSFNTTVKGPFDHPD
jgi:hypothetical protein